jgi:hypothetical protein
LKGANHLSRPYISNELFHLVGRSHPTDHKANYETLLKVLDSNCVSHPPHNPDFYAHQISFNWNRNILSEELIVPSITCFCDIPFETLEIHMKKYGKFGLSFPREFLIKYGARPVIYMPMQPSDPQRGWGTIHCEALLHDLEQIWRGFREHLIDPIAAGSRSRSLGRKPHSPEAAAMAMDDVFTQQFLAFIKPFNSELPNDHPNNFYLEREWRKFGNLGFQPRDVMHVIVEPDYIERLKKERPAYSDKVVAAPE